MPLGIVITMFCLTVTAGVAKAVQDTISTRFSTSIFSRWRARYWNPSVSWKNKYRDYDAGDTRPAFLFSKTWLVALTDAWHLMDALHLYSITVAAMLAGWFSYPSLWLCFVTYGLTLILARGVFHIFYTYIFTRT